MSVGTPPQPLRCLLDSGSADLWVPSRRCETCTDERSFQADRSSSFTPRWLTTEQGLEPETVHIAYGSGDIVGYSVEDTVAFGSVQILNQSFVIVEDAALPQHRAWDGICGLGWQQMAKVGRPVYRRLQEMGARAVFTLVPSEQSKAFLVIGDVPEAVYRSGTLVWTEAESLVRGQRSFWVTTGGVAIHANAPIESRFLVDTGTNYLLAPASQYDNFVESLLPRDVFDSLCGLEMGMVVCDCSVIENPNVLPVRIYLGGRAFVLEVEHLFKRVPAEDEEGHTEDLCLLQIQPNAEVDTTESAIPADPLQDILSGILSGGRGSSQVPGGPPLGGSPFFPGQPAGGLPPGPLGGPPPGGPPPGGPPPGGPLFGGPPSGGSPPGGPPPAGPGTPLMPGIPLMPGLPLLPQLAGPQGGQVPAPPGTDASGRASQNGSSMPGGLTSFPFPFGLMLPSAALTGDGVEEIVTTRPNGSYCNTRIVRSRGAVTSNTTQCFPASSGSGSVAVATAAAALAPQLMPGRRLQLLPLRSPSAGEAAAVPDPAELWILGGVFLEHFVSAFDFEHARLGFAEPSGAPPPVAQSYAASAAVPGLASAPPAGALAGRSAVVLLAAGAVACAAGASVLFRLSHRGRVALVTPIGDKGRELEAAE